MTWYQNEGDGFGSDKMGNVKVECVWCRGNILFFLYCMISVLFEFPKKWRCHCNPDLSQVNCSLVDTTMTMWSRMLLKLVYIHILDMDYIILLYRYLQLPLLLSNQYGTQNILLLQLPLLPTPYPLPPSLSIRSAYSLSCLWIHTYYSFVYSCLSWHPSDQADPLLCLYY